MELRAYILKHGLRASGSLGWDLKDPLAGSMASGKLQRAVDSKVGSRLRTFQSLGRFKSLSALQWLKHHKMPERPPQGFDIST